MNVLLFGHGGREHALAEAFARSPKISGLCSYMRCRNPGIEFFSKNNCIGDYGDAEKIKNFARENKIDFSFIGPELPLSLGVVDILKGMGIPSVGPTKKLSRLESSKSFTRDLLEKYKISGNPRFKIFSSEIGIADFMEELGGFVIKADGLKSGKGVKVSGEHLANIDEGMQYARECLLDGRVVIEEKLEGEEFSLQCFADGMNISPAPLVQDHKRAYEGDAGPNTGGMGSYSDKNHLLPFLKNEHKEAALEITKKVLLAIKEETGEFYQGIMYGGFMLTARGVRLIEYNARLGDPEAINILPILKTDLADLSLAIINQKLDGLKVEFENKATVCKYLAPAGYPDNPIENGAVDFSAIPKTARLYYASATKKGKEIIFGASRGAAILGIGENIEEAEAIAEAGASAVAGNIFYRKDIGTKKIIEKRMGHIKNLGI
ncbi:MAG: phosphoribosylamine--glycine ligase [Patescibacteria group bacterium]